MEAYKNYEEMEFKTKCQQKEIYDDDRHVKLISIAELKVPIKVVVYINLMAYFLFGEHDTDYRLHLFFYIVYNYRNYTIMHYS